MKKLYLFIFTALSLLAVRGQEAAQPVRFANGVLTAENAFRGPWTEKGKITPSLYTGRYYVLLRFTELPSVAVRQQLEAKGIQLGAYIPSNAYFASVPESFNFSEAAAWHIHSAAVVPALYKYDRDIALSMADVKPLFQDPVAVGLIPGISRAEAETQLQSLGAVLVATKFNTPGVIFIRPGKAAIAGIAALPFVASLSRQSFKEKELNYNSTAMHGIGGLQSAWGQNLNGKDVVVGVGDNGEISTAHVDFSARVINRVPFPISFHGIHVSGTVSGGGILNPLYKGMAPRSTLISHWFSDIVTNAPVYVTDNNLVATNNSYTDADDSCGGAGAYDILSQYVDNQMRQNKTLLHIFAAGNDGEYTCSPYPDSFATVKSGWQAAKNVLTVGAVDSNYRRTDFTSRGPVNDGRIKPEIMAKGEWQISTRQNNTYGVNSGTSMASPVVTGAAALLNEKYRRLFGGATPRADLIKALLCNTAEDLGKHGPDFTYGFGMLNTRRAVAALEANQFFTGNSTGLPQSYPITVPAGVRWLKVMLYWADTSALPNAASTLVNDLDLVVTDPSSNPYLPLVPDATPANVQQEASPQADHINNMEQVVIEDPTPGTYNINISAFAIPQGTQDYVVTYQFDMNGITVEHPFGGETWVPGETENIRWTAFGDEGKTFTVEYTDDNSNWMTINNSVPADSKSIPWVVPSTVTNLGRIRVKRNASVYSDVSDTIFIVLGQPVISQTVPCEGFVQLSWTAVSGATSYDVMQLMGDTMTVITNTTSLNYLVKGLSSSTAYWFSVRAKNNAEHGRRSVAVTVTPASGTCSLPAYDNNFKAVSIIAPVSGRELTSSAFTGSEQVRLTIKNLDNAASSGTYQLYYQVNGGAIINESSSTVVAALGTTTYSFAATNAFLAPGVYTIKAWVKRTGDNEVLDDTTTITIKNIANPPLTLPVTDDFETATVKTYTTSTIGFDGIDKADLKTNTVRGRARTFVNTGFAHSGSKAITLDQFPYNAALNTDSLLMTYNIATYNTGNQLRLDFWYKNHGQANNPNNKVWIRGNDTQPWVYAYDLVYNQAAMGGWKHASVNINDVLDTVLPVQTIGTSFQVKFGQQGNTSANIPYPDLDQDDGYTFDDVQLQEVSSDIGILSVLSPAVNGCGMAGSQPVTLSIKNYSAATFNNVPVYYRVNNGAPVAGSIGTLLPGVNSYTFPAPVNLAANTSYTFDFWVDEPSNNYATNDSVLNYRLHTSALVNTYPYLEGFEAGDGGWYTGGQNSSWQWGTPGKQVISKAANGTKAWVTGLTANYQNREFSYLYSPCFDLSSLTQPVLSFSHIFLIEDATPTDYNWVEYSVDGVTWSRLGTNGAGTNWYNDPTGANQWRTSIPRWHVASIDIPVKGTAVRFRIVMSSNSALNTDGVGVDDIHIFDKALIYTGTSITGLTQTVSGSNWVHFTSGGRRVASINANGNNLGSTVVDGYPYSGTVRTRNSQYYLNRNIVIRPANQPAGYTTVRFYFTEAEAVSLINATGCGNCSKPADAYELGVTKYSGTAIQENGTLDDNFGGAYSYILPANTEIIPYDNGYYAEFPVSSFSEFWLNNGGINGNQPLPLHLIAFDVMKQGKQALLLWTTENEINTSQYIIERSGNGRDFTTIGNETALNSAGRLNYQHTDPLPFSGWNYYRLKMVDKDGHYSYSPVRKLNFDAAEEDVRVYPNPLTGGKLNITSTVNCRRLIVVDPAGRQISSVLLQGRLNQADLSGLAKGLYLLKIVTDNGTRTVKLSIP